MFFLLALVVELLKLPADKTDRKKKRFKLCDAA
jgi:hypothetical protein